MGVQSAGRRVAYDRLWGGLLLATAFLPVRVGDETHTMWGAAAALSPGVALWLILGALTGLVALATGFLGRHGRGRHFTNFSMAVAVLALPIFAPAIWEQFPDANPARLPVRDLAGVGWVMLIAILTIYAGAGIRITRPNQIVGQILSGCGALLLMVFALMPVGREKHRAFIEERVKMLLHWGTRWREAAPFTLLMLAAFLALMLFIRTRREVLFARLTRALLTAGILFPLAMPLIEAVVTHQPLWPQLPMIGDRMRLLAPMFLALDGCIAVVAISITRSSD